MSQERRAQADIGAFGHDAAPARHDPARQAHDLASAFARQIATWARASGASEAAVQAATLAARDTSLATSEGHVCLTLADRPDMLRLRALLLASGVVGAAAHPGARPLVIDDAHRLYLHRYFDLECRLARRLRQAAQAPVDTPDAVILELLRMLFGGAGSALTLAHTAAAVRGQQHAVDTALRGRLTVISGGPGTGKTTTVVNLLACLLAQDPHSRIALAAPTGKAAARMTQALRERAAHLPAALRERLPVEASTVHRLLGRAPGGGFAHHAGNRLPISVLVVDEASMLDLALATRLLEAVPDAARIILLGDKDQLAAVESGSVFAEISARPTRDTAPGSTDHTGSGLPARVVWLEHNFRFAGDSGVGQLASHIQAGRGAEALATLRAGGQGTLHWLDEPEPPVLPSVLPSMWPTVESGYAAYFDAVAAGDLLATARAWDAFRVLCAVHDGPRGVMAVNERVTLWARQRLRALDTAPRSPWYAGRPVMVLRNDPALRLYNGDIGLTLPDPAADGALRVFFPAAAATASGPGAWRGVAPSRLPEHLTAFAMTVHKAQGSEFDHALLLLPAQGSRVLSRELLYTAVTRVRRELTLCASAAVLTAALAQPTRRESGLHDRLLASPS